MLDSENIENELTWGSSLLRGQYRIERSIGRGGFGITYLARDSLNRQVVIKECFPSEICVRSGTKVRAYSQSLQPHFFKILAQFQSEARSLAELSHPRIVGVHQIFAENDTAYMAMDFVEGADLMTIVETDPDRLTPELVHNILVQVLPALQYMHRQGLLHRDIAPDNFILGPDNQITLIDFGAAYADFDNDGSSDAKLLAVKDGYSPYEFYVADKKHDASSDLYSLGATFHLLVTGQAPVSSEERLAKATAAGQDPYVSLLRGDWDYDPRFLDAIDRALAIHQNMRLQSADNWLAHLSGPMPVKEIEFDPNLVETIAELVSMTNRNLTQGSPRILRKSLSVPEAAAEAAVEPQKPKLFVDILGNPIDDVDAFLREQDMAGTTNANDGSDGSVTGTEPPGRKGEASRYRKRSLIIAAVVYVLRAIFSRPRADTKRQTEDGLLQT